MSITAFRYDYGGYNITIKSHKKNNCQILG